MNYIFTFIIAWLLSGQLIAQRGYIKLNSNDSIINGYVKFTPALNVIILVEVWQTKTDKSPLKISRTSICEYAIVKDTFIVLLQYKPFENTDTYMERVEGKVISRGEINLYEVDYSAVAKSMSVGKAGGMGTYARISIPIADENMAGLFRIYILEHKKTGYKRAVPADKENLTEVLPDFFPERYLKKYAEVKGKGEIKYKALPALVKLYNSK